MNHDGAKDDEGHDEGGGAELIGRVASPPSREATSEEFHFWVPRGKLVEKTQLVSVDCQIGGRKVSFFALVSEVYRQSRRRHISEEFDSYDGTAESEPPFSGDGVSFAAATILRAEPSVLTAPIETSPVRLATHEEVSKAYGSDEIEPRDRMPIGLVKNGGERTAGPGVIDLDYLLGGNGGHMNVNGVAGLGTKSSFLLFSLSMLLARVRAEARRAPSSLSRRHVVPIILNVKGFDLMHIHRLSSRFRADEVEQRRLWAELGVTDPQPFTAATFYAPQSPRGEGPIDTGSSARVTPYSWALADVIREGLFPYLFADEDSGEEVFGALLRDLEGYLTRETVRPDGTLLRELRRGDGRPDTFDGLLQTIEALSESKDGPVRGHHSGTWARLRRRLLNLLLSGHGVLRRTEVAGRPLRLTAGETRDPAVVDLCGLSGAPALQRFVLAAILEQLIQSRRGAHAVRNLCYVVALDELNRFAPHGARDAITRRVELVAAEMRSQGIILLGAQQQASKVSEKVIENASIKVLGRSGALELSHALWRFLGDSARRKAAALPRDEKLVLQEGFRAPMHVRVPLPPWAMRADEVELGHAQDEDEPIEEL